MAAPGVGRERPWGIEEAVVALVKLLEHLHVSGAFGPRLLLGMVPSDPDLSELLVQPLDLGLEGVHLGTEGVHLAFQVCPVAYTLLCPVTSSDRCIVTFLVTVQRCHYRCNELSIFRLYVCPHAWCY